MHLVLRIGNSPVNSNHRNCYYKVKLNCYRHASCALGVHGRSRVLLFDIQHIAWLKETKQKNKIDKRYPITHINLTVLIKACLYPYIYWLCSTCICYYYSNSLRLDTAIYAIQHISLNNQSTVIIVHKRPKVLEKMKSVDKVANSLQLSLYQ